MILYLGTDEYGDPVLVFKCLICDQVVGTLGPGSFPRSPRSIARIEQESDHECGR